MATIDIIIPAGNAHELIEKTLFSIAYQINAIEINVYIVNDESKKDYKQLIKYFSNFIKIKELKHKGKIERASALQYGIDNSNSKYIIFINPGDTLASPIAVSTLKQAIIKDKADIATSYIKVQLANGEIQNSDSDIVSLYGKIYERKFLKENGISFWDTNLNEDVSFNTLAFFHNAKIVTVPEYTYIKLYNYEIENEKRNPDYYYNNMFSYIRNLTYVLNTAIKQGLDKGQIGYFAFHTLISSYYYYIDLEEELRKAELLKCTKKIYSITKKYPITDAQKGEIWQSQFLPQSSNISIESRLNPPISLNEFKQMVEKM